jgi:sortase (surface protein transpeptidase)
MACLDVAAQRLLGQLMGSSIGTCRRNLVVVAAGALAFALLTGCGPAAGTAPVATASLAATPGSTRAGVKAGGIAPMVSQIPLRVTVPAIGVDSTLVALGLNADRTIQVPPLSQAKQAGYYRYGPTPGSQGPAVILGHIDGNGQKGVFYRLQDMIVGEQVTVGRADNETAVFTVYLVERAPKADFPTQKVYGPTSDAQLRLISCGGVLDRQAHSYLDNVIVFAILTAAHPT